MAYMPQRYPASLGIRFDTTGKVYVDDVLVGVITSGGELRILGDIKANRSSLP